MNSYKRTILSVLVPVYNWDISLLFDKLAEEIHSGMFNDMIEVIVIDDCSTDDKIRTANGKKVLECRNTGANIKYSELRKNLGRALTRNKLAEQASGEFLLFLDADVLPDQTDFLRRYIDYISKNEWDVVCGGLSSIHRKMIDKKYDFCFYWNTKIVAKAAEVRNKTPWRYLWTSNIMVRKSVFHELPFDERFSGYGFEDSEWGIRLSNKYKVLHIDNTVSHLGLVTKETAYKKMRDSIENYVLLAKLHPGAFQETRIHRIAGRLSSFNSSLLDIMDVLLRKMFSSIKNNKISFLIFQINKAVLFARQLKSN
jgi:glycosyltransferase involved in cell wall biosynthesis